MAGYEVINNDVFKERFRYLRTARKFAYQYVHKTGKPCSIYLDGELEGHVRRTGNTIFYESWYSKIQWILKKDGTVGEKYRW